MRQEGSFLMKSLLGSRSWWTLAAVLFAAACGQETLVPEEVPSSLEAAPQAVGSTNKVLILATTVWGGSASPEATAARNLGYTVELASDAAWGAKTAADFATYRALILGDAHCTGLSAASAAIANRKIWGPVVNGNVILVGTDPVFHGKTLVSSNSVEFAAAKEGMTGMYISLSCYYHDTAPGTAPALLDQFGAFTLTGVGCYNNVHLVASHPALAGLSDTYLSGWGCSVHEAFDGYPEANFTPLAIARDPISGPRLPGSRDFADGTHGVPYILVRGATPVLCGDRIIQPPEECDAGPDNGVPGNPCSSTCRLHWCGDNIKDSGEECDEGARNGLGSCSASCKLISICGNGVVEPGEECDEGANNGKGRCTLACTLLPDTLPPVARCKNLHLTADAMCGASGSIDNGSSDPDGDLVGCTQSPAGPYPLGETHVKLTCVDRAGHTASCVSHVEVEDATGPALSCPAASTAECVGGSATVDPGAATATDNCGVASVSAPGASSYPLGTTPVSYTAADTSGNTATCTSHVTVSDTLSPSLALLGSPVMALECAVDTWSDPGASATDLCAGNITSSVSRSGTVNTSAVGSYAIAYGVTDPAGHAASPVYRAVTVADTLAPALALLGSNPMALECGIDSYSEPGARATDRCAGDLAVAITSAGVDTHTVGSYAVAYSATDPSGNSSAATRTINVADHTPPAITLRGSASIVLECSSAPYVDAGATASDACYGDLTGSIVSAGVVNPSVPGTYTISYDVKDGAGLSAPTQLRTVEVVDSTPPVLVIRPTDTIWPPNHKMRSFQLSDCAVIEDTCDGTLDINTSGAITSIYSDEPEDEQGNGDGHTHDDIVITGNSSFELRAERQGAGNGRVYGVNFTVTDRAGNQISSTCRFAVPHDQSGRPATDDGQGAGYVVTWPGVMAGR
jgi:cysteine-rich repeat protein